jgi:hypothetical protein
LAIDERARATRPRAAGAGIDLTGVTAEIAGPDRRLSRRAA